ncbi:ABC transporter permease [Salipaludibacillus sp. HK11]|uniref:ABC transporter permease n=1 Tax=Salipaludibacillus sp. HK11 TaxID=3394320 RepID=UPI0039FC53BA
MKLLADSWYMTERNLRGVSRSPFLIGINLFQPILWLLLFSSLFSSIVDIPGFTSSSYLEFFSPGIVVMSTLLSGGFVGMSIIVDLNQGVLNRFLVSPVRRSSLIIGPLMQNTVTMGIQGLIIIVLALLMGARFPGGITGIFILLIVSVLLGMGFGALSIALSLVIQKEEGLISTANLMTMPLIFVSSLFMPIDLVPNWIKNIALFNPVNWAIEAGREALGASANWNLIITNVIYLNVFLLLAMLLALQVFKRYQKMI